MQMSIHARALDQSQNFSSRLMRSTVCVGARLSLHWLLRQLPSLWSVYDRHAVPLMPRTDAHRTHARPAQARSANVVSLFPVPFRVLMDCSSGDECCQLGRSTIAASVSEAEGGLVMDQPKHKRASEAISRLWPGAAGVSTVSCDSKRA